jgi:hypothetical protein
MLIAVFLLGSLLTAAPPSNARLDAFLVELQRASARDDRRALAAMVEYPLTVFAGGWNIPLKDRATFLQSYDAFFTEDVKDAIAGAVDEAARRAERRLHSLWQRHSDQAGRGDIPDRGNCDAAAGPQAARRPARHDACVLSCAPGRREVRRLARRRRARVLRRAGQTERVARGPD